MIGRYEDKEYLEKNDEEQETVRRRKSLIALAVMAVLAVAGIVLVERLRNASVVQDCLTARATNCNDLVQQPVPAGVR